MTFPTDEIVSMRTTSATCDGTPRVTSTMERSALTDAPEESSSPEHAAPDHPLSAPLPPNFAPKRSISPLEDDSPVKVMFQENPSKPTSDRVTETPSTLLRRLIYVARLCGSTFHGIHAVEEECNDNVNSPDVTRRDGFRESRCTSNVLATDDAT